MLGFSLKITKKYSLDISGFHQLRRLKDGLSFFEFKVNFDKFKGDHNPKFEIHFVLLNFKIFEINIYNINHQEG